MYKTFHKLRISHVLSRNFLTEDFLPFKILYIFVKKINWSKKITKNGMVINILIKQGIGIMNFISNYEEWLDEILFKILDKENAVFIDIGANVGQTIIKVLPLYPNIRYVAVEPNSHCVNYLLALIKANNFNNVKIIECALSDSEGKAELLLRYGDDILATTTHQFRKFTKYVVKATVNTITGDTLIKAEDLTHVSVIKIDIEGGEAQAIDGLLDTIRNFQPYIICEILPLNTEDEEVTSFRIMSSKKIFLRLCELDYSAMNIVTGNLVNDVNDLSASLESCNYLFMPKKKLPSFKLN